jgi:hypothetical protein
MFICTTQKGKTLATPDVCKTPAPPGPPIPMPYVNTANLAMANPVARKVLIGGAPALNKTSKIAMSSGDNAGVAGGVMSNAFMQEVSFTSASNKVLLAGKPAVRLMDQIKANKGNAMGTVVQPSQTKVNAG